MVVQFRVAQVVRVNVVLAVVSSAVVLVTVLSVGPLQVMADSKWWQQYGLR